jgi:hypothetical protein
MFRPKWRSPASRTFSPVDGRSSGERTCLRFAGDSGGGSDEGSRTGGSLPAIAIELTAKRAFVRNAA